MEEKIVLNQYELDKAKSSAVFNALCKKANMDANLMKLRAVIVGVSPLMFNENLSSKKGVYNVVEKFNNVYNDELLKNMTDDMLLEFISTLTEREADVIKKRFSLIECGYNPTLDNVATELGLTRERIKQIEAKALRKLRLRICKKLHSDRFKESEFDIFEEFGL